mmetsp:Transcript_1385/g.3388  ORF Transcript_1385/g.3388 Transcript_1385/m.3388 type:complete len:80 (+) Transcript_1385:172-411(+)
MPFESEEEKARNALRAALENISSNTWLPGSSKARKQRLHEVLGTVRPPKLTISNLMIRDEGAVQVRGRACTPSGMEAPH